MCRRVCDVMIEKLPNLHHQQCRHLTLGVIVIIVITIIIIATAVVTATAAAAVTVAPVVTAVAAAPFTARAVVVVVVAVRIEIEVTPAVQYVADASRVRQRFAVGCGAWRVYTCGRWQNHSTCTNFFPAKHSTLN